MKVLTLANQLRQLANHLERAPHLAEVKQVLITAHVPEDGYSWKALAQTMRTLHLAETSTDQTVIRYRHAPWADIGTDKENISIEFWKEDLT